MHFSSRNKTKSYLCKIAGPVVLSAFSLFLLFWIIQPLALFLDPTFSLLANKGIGKIGMVTMVLIHILLIASTASKDFFATWKEKNFVFISKRNWLSPFLTYFCLFAFFHCIVLFGFCISKQLIFDPSAFLRITSQSMSLFIGFIATFFLAWTEEVIFRGTLYPYVSQYISKFWAILFSSLIFCLAHNLTNPIALVTSTWRLGLGLFLLGTLLNLIFAITNTLYMGMGAHAGLVFIKVFLRRIPAVIPIISTTTPWWFSPDLREAFPVHILFIIIISCLVLQNHEMLFRKPLPR